MLPKQFYYKKNRLQQLKGFYYTVQTGSISKAAEKMGLTQSAITLQIQSLERDLKTKLFTRSRKSIFITEEGKSFYAHSIKCIHEIDNLFESFANLSIKKKSEVIDFAINHVGISYIIPKYIKKFKDQNPEVKFTIRNLEKKDAIHRLINDELNFIIYPMSKKEIPDELDFIPIVTYYPILLVDSEHELAKKKNVTLSDMSKYELIRIDPKLITLPTFEEIIKSHGIKSTITFEMADWEILKKFVEAKIGIAVVSDIMMEGNKHHGLVGRSLANYFPEMTYGIMFKKSKIFNGLSGDFIKMLQTQKLLKAQKDDKRNLDYCSI